MISFTDGHKSSLFLLLGLICQASYSFANSGPLPIVNKLPVMNGSGLGVPQAAALLADGNQKFSIGLNLESNANDSASEDELLIIDGESTSLDLAWRRSVFKRWQFGADLSWIQHSPGSFDNAIDSWHDFFGLSSGDRPLFEANQLRFEYIEQNQGQFQSEIHNRVSGLSDLTVHLGYQFKTFRGIQSAAHLSINLPTGKRNSAIGSEKADVGLSLAIAPLEDSVVTWHANIGYLIIGDDQLFSIRTRSGAWFSSAGVHWRMKDNWRLSAQLDGHANIFYSRIPELNKDAWQLGLGASYTGFSNSGLQFYFTEDVSVNRASDFAFGVNWSTNY